MEPSSAKATQAQREIAPPRIHTRKNNFGFGNGPAISFAVKKMEEPITPLTSSNTESSKVSPRTRLGCSVGALISSVRDVGVRLITLTGFLSHAQFVGRFERRAATAADDCGAIAAGQRIDDCNAADRTI
jgi:hypothetical protein